MPAQVNIVSAGTAQAVLPGSQLTAAQFIAVQQILHTGVQTILLDAKGAAVGGSVVIGPCLGSHISNLVIPQGVTVIDRSAMLNLSGNLSNSGTLYALSSNPAVASFNITAANVFNQSGALLTTSLPPGGLPGFAGAVANLNLNVSALNSIINAGTISSAGNLALSAGGCLINALPSGLSGPSPVMRAGNDLNLSAANLVNSGIIAAGGNLNLYCADVVNTRGTLKALSGAINVSAVFAGAESGMSLIGGDWLSRELNCYAGAGSVSADVNEIQGILNIHAKEAHALVSSGALRLGNLELAGDPTFFNNAANGDVTINGDITVGEALTIVASRDILSSGDFALRANDGARGFEINLIAGANISAPGSTSGAVLGPFTSPPSAGTGTPAVAAITIDGPSSTGGDVTFSGHNMTISSAAVTAFNSGGDVRIIAFTNSTSTSGGHVSLSPGTSISSGGLGTGANGAIQILAGAASGTAISTGSLNSAGGTGGGGNIDIRAAQGLPNPNPVTINANGALLAGNQFDAATINPASIAVNGNIVSGGNLVMASAGSVTVGSSVSANTAGKTITIESQGDLCLAGTGTLSTSSTGSTSFSAMTAGSTLSIADGTSLTIAGGGELDIRSPNLKFAGSTSSPSITASGASYIKVDSGTSAADVDLNITAAGGLAGTLATNGGIILIRPTGQGSGSFLRSGIGATIINLNGGGALGSGLVDLQGFGDFTIAAPVTLSSNSPIQVNLNSSRTFTLDGVLQTTASNSTFPDPLGGVFYYSLLVQNLITDFSLAGSGTFRQAGPTGGNTVFNDFTHVTFADGASLHIDSLSSGSYANFYTRQIGVSRLVAGAAAASLTVSNVVAVNFNTNLPSFGPGDVAFLPRLAATSATLNVSGAPVNAGFRGTPPPASIPAMQQPVANITVGSNFTLASQGAVNMYATNSINVLGAVSSAGAPIQFASFSATGPVNVLNNGLIQSIGASGIIGFNGGATGAISLGGTGSLAASQVNFGNLNLSTGQIIAPFVTVKSPFSGTFSLGNISLTQGLISGLIQVSLPPPPSPATASSQNGAFSIFIPFLNQIQQQASAANRVSSSIIPTDTTAVQLQLVLQRNLELQGYVARDDRDGQAGAIDMGGLSAARIYLGSQFDLPLGQPGGMVAGPGTGGNYLNLVNGAGIFLPPSEIVIQTSESKIVIAGGSAVMVAERGGVLAIYNLHDRTRQDVKVFVGRCSMVVPVGQALVLSRHAGLGFEAINPERRIAYRHPEPIDPGNGVKGYIAEFSIFSALTVIDPLRSLVKSGSRDARRFVGTLLKNSAIMARVTGARGPYKTAN